MKMYNIQHNSKTVAYLNIFTDLDARNGELIGRILDGIHDDPDIGFAGFRHKDGLKEHLKWKMDEIKDIQPIDETKVKDAIEEAINKCLSFVNVTKPFHIFVFPTFNEFVKEKMNGVNGYSPWRNTILIYVNPVEGWDAKIGSTVCHEFAHAIAQNYNYMINILDQLIFDGMAEHFREFVIGGDKAPWANALTEKEAKKILDEIKNYFDSTDEKIRKEIFYGTGKYPLWAGYAIGYYVVYNFLKRQNKINWNDILKISPQRMLDESKALS